MPTGRRRRQDQNLQNLQNFRNLFCWALASGRRRRLAVCRLNVCLWRGGPSAEANGNSFNWDFETMLVLKFNHCWWFGFGGPSAEANGNSFNWDFETMLVLKLSHFWWFSFGGPSAEANGNSFDWDFETMLVLKLSHFWWYGILLAAWEGSVSLSAEWAAESEAV